nr:MAG TPA: hypothetical protein [Caudoviricetes sp.]
MTLYLYTLPLYHCISTTLSDYHNRAIIARLKHR